MTPLRTAVGPRTLTGLAQRRHGADWPTTISRLLALAAALLTSVGAARAGSGAGVAADSMLASLRIVVRDTLGHPLQSVTVIVHGTGVLDVTDQFGMAILPGISLGSHGVQVLAFGYERSVTSVRFFSGARETLTVRMVPNRRTDPNEIDLPVSILDPAFGLKNRFRPHFGLVLVGPAGPVLAASGDSIARGTQVTALFLDGKSRARALRVLDRMEQQEVVGRPAYIATDPWEPRYFRLEWVKPADAALGHGLGVIGASGGLSGGSWQAKVDVNGDGRREELWACNQDSYLWIYVREPNSQFLVWAGACKFGTHVPPVCKPIDEYHR